MFDKLKKDYLEKEDKSKIGEIDKEIKELVDKINSFDDYFTTSSCSGRIVLQTGEKKSEVEWVKVSHDFVDLDWVKGVELSSRLLWFRMEPMILHVACSSVEKAQRLLDKVQPIFKKSFIQTTRNKVMVEIKGSECVVTPVANGKWLVDDKYLKVLVEEGNKKLERTREKITELCAIF
ncbi:MAG: hypothetical protein KAT77_03320 [Nanoarchaeota archaeon]|nr:hypothetical protein [Nanoarchaeota archaeon]